MSYKTTQTLEKDEATGDVVLRENGQKVNGTAAAADVTTSPTDTTSGRVMKVGDFGLGREGWFDGITDFNNLDPQATRFFSHTGAGTPANAPFNTQAAGFSIHGWEYNKTTLQFWTPIQNAFGALRPFIRIQDFDGNWKGWQELYNQSNILGTVSQSGGVPTGAIIERGSNANGEYVKFADGTLICTKDITSGADPNIWNFPVTFIHRPVVSVTITAAAPRTVSIGAPTFSEVEIYIYTSDTGVSSLSSWSATAIGRWY